LSLLLLLLLAAGPAVAGAPEPEVRVYSLHSISAINLEPENGTSRADGQPLTGKASIRAKGSLVTLEGKHRTGQEKTITAKGGIWLSGAGLPRRLYHGTLSFTARKGRLMIINTVPLEHYISSVVTGEASDLSQLEAYKAQAVAARTYTLKHSRNHYGEGYRLCDSTHCQLYTGAARISTRALIAAESTRGQILVYRGAPAETYYHSVCGGRTATMNYVWPFDHKSYLVSVKDGPVSKPYCSIAPRFRWKTKIYYTGLTRLSRKVRWILPDEEAQGLKISAWGESGRAAELEIQTQRRRVKVSATDFYHGIGRRAGWNAVRSSWFRILQGRDYVLLDGVGNGHGVGLCQWGAEGMARLGFKYRDILKHYYPGTEIR
jgi:stage II sporulation protein D